VAVDEEFLETGLRFFGFRVHRFHVQATYPVSVSGAGVIES